MTDSFKRYAIVSLRNATGEMIGRYLPSNYTIAGFVPHDPESSDNLLSIGACVVIEGRDDHGWTLDGYVLPRLASGLITGHEIGLDHPVMKRLPA